MGLIFASRNCRERGREAFDPLASALLELGLGLGRFVLAGGLVGLGRVELPTSPLSGVRSSHLSYRPVTSVVSSQLSVLSEII